MAPHIQLSLGLQRGKSHKIDAGTIALFAYKNRGKIKPWQPLLIDDAVKKPACSKGTRLLQAKVKLAVPVKELDKEGLQREATHLSR
jgi:hypothetical protein